MLKLALLLDELDHAPPLRLQVLLANAELVVRRGLLFGHLATILLNQRLVLLVHKIRQLRHGFSLTILDDLPVTHCSFNQSPHFVLEPLVLVEDFFETV